jgi:hypothetical protein
MNSSAETIYTDWIVEDGLYYPISFEGEILHTCGFKKVENFCEGIANVSDGSKWGCIDCFGNIFIPIKYDSISIEEYEYACFYLRCGYNGELFSGVKEFISCKEETIYTGVYDLYNINGEFLIGGFDECKYDSESQTFQFLFGREWILYYSENKFSFDKNKYRINDRNTKWLVLTKDFLFPFNFHYQTANLHQIEKNSPKGKRLSYKRIHLQTLGGELLPDSMFTSEEWVNTQYSKNALYIDLPGEVLFDSVSTINRTTLLCSKDSQYCLIRLDSRSKTDYYKYIKPIDNVYAFVYDGLIGLLKGNQLILSCQYSYLTNPVNDCVFAIRQYPYVPDSNLWNKYYVLFLNLKKRNNLIYDFELKKETVAISEIDRDNVESYLSKGIFRIYLAKNNTGLNDITIRKGFFHYFTEQFKQIVNRPGHTLTDEEKRRRHYWISHKEMKRLREGPPKEYYFEHYSIWDALDGDPGAYWNID